MTRSGILLAIAALAGLAVALPERQTSGCRDTRICVDAVNKCGQKYGGCFNPCSEKKPTPPPCPVTTSSPVATSTPTTKDDCRTRTVCIDAINSCGIPYGGCIPDCRPWALTTPTCPPATTSPTSSY